MLPIALVLAQTGPIKIDFEGLPSMTFHTGNPVPESARLSHQFLAKYGVRFSSGAQYVAVMEEGSGHAVSGVNGISGATPEGILTYSPDFPIEVAFFDPENPEAPAYTDYVSFRMDLAATSGKHVTLKAYDAYGNPVASTTKPDEAGGTLRVQGKGRGIHMVRFFGRAMNGIGLDDLEFNPVRPVRFAPMRDGRVRVVIDGKLIVFPDGKPLWEKGHLLLPVCSVSKEMDAEMFTEEEGGIGQSVTIDRGDVHIKFDMNESLAQVGDQVFVIETPARYIDKRGYFPLRFVAEVLGAKLKWDEETQTVSITTR